VKIKKQKQILPLRGRMTTKSKSNGKAKADSSAALRNDKQEMRCGMTNKKTLRNDKQKSA
jgi:hypothetical protein